MKSAPKRRGRPPSTLKKIFITIPLPEPCYRKLDAYARQKNKYKGEIIANLIDDADLRIAEFFVTQDGEDIPRPLAYTAGKS